MQRSPATQAALALRSLARCGVLAVTRGRVSSFDQQSGLGVITTADAAEFPFHCVEIADGTRTIDVGVDVEFEPLRKLGRIEAATIRPIGR